MAENIINKSVLTDGILALSNYFKEHGYKLAFEKILAESAELYNVDSKRAITEHQFSISGIITIKEEQRLSL